MAPFFINRHLFDLSPLGCDDCLSGIIRHDASGHGEVCYWSFLEGGFSKKCHVGSGIEGGGNSVKVPAGDVGKSRMRLS